MPQLPLNTTPSPQMPLKKESSRLSINGGSRLNIEQDKLPDEADNLDGINDSFMGAVGFLRVALANLAFTGGNRTSKTGGQK